MERTVIDVNRSDAGGTGLLSLTETTEGEKIGGSKEAAGPSLTMIFVNDNYKHEI